MSEVESVDLGRSGWEGVPTSNPPTRTRQANVYLSQFGLCSIVRRAREYSSECLEFVTRTPSLAEHNSVWHAVKDWKQKEF